MSRTVLSTNEVLPRGSCCMDLLLLRHIIYLGLKEIGDLQISPQNLMLCLIQSIIPQGILKM